MTRLRQPSSSGRCANDRPAAGLSCGPNPPPLRLLLAGASPSPDETVVCLPLEATGVGPDLRFAAQPTDARLADLVAPAAEVCDLLMDGVRRRAESAGRRVSCSKGCSACCRYMVPLSPPEAFALADEVDHIPASRRATAEKRFDLAAKKLLAASAAINECGTAEQISQWYWGLQLSCPLLDRGKGVLPARVAAVSAAESGGVCSVYAGRPLACREHYVLCRPSECADATSAESAGEVPLSMAQVLCHAAALLEGAEPQSLLLPVSVLWARENSARRARTWPAADLARALASALRSARHAAA